MNFKLPILFLILPFIAWLVFNPIKSVFAQSAPVSDAQITIIGDSLTEGAKSILQQQLPNAAIDSAVGRRWGEGISIVSDLKNSGQLKPLVVFALGTNNSSLSSGDIDNLLNAAPDSQIILVTTFNSVHKDWADNVNAAIDTAASAHADRIKIANWNSVVSANPGLIDNSDRLGVHPTNPDGRQAFAKVISDTVAGAGPIGPGTPGQTAVSNCVVTKIGDVGDKKPVLPPGCQTSINGLETPPNLECSDGKGRIPAGYCKMPDSTDDSYRFSDPSCSGHHWGSQELISALYTVAKNWKVKYPQGHINIRDMTAAEHGSHFWGIAVDMNATTNGGDWVADMTQGNYNHDATIELGKMFADTNIIAEIWYNDIAVNSAVLAYAKGPPSKSSFYKSTPACPECSPDHGGMLPLELHDNHFHVDIDRAYLPDWGPSCSE